MQQQARRSITGLTVTQLPDKIQGRWFYQASKLITL
jgi:hypothetical protein